MAQSVTLLDALRLLEKHIDANLHEGNCDWDVFGERVPCTKCVQAKNKLYDETFEFILKYRLLSKKWEDL